MFLTSSVWTNLPFLKIEQVSATAKISSNLCEINSIDLPSFAKFFIISNNSSISWGVKTAVGSSKIKMSFSL